MTPCALPLPSPVGVDDMTVIPREAGAPSPVDHGCRGGPGFADVDLETCVRRILHRRPAVGLAVGVVRDGQRQIDGGTYVGA
jgi:hypothetical protein